MATRLESLERQLEGLVERALPRLLGGQFSVPVIAAQLARTVEAGLVRDQRGRWLAPDQYVLSLHPNDLDALLEQAPDLGRELSEGLAEVSRTLGYAMALSPEVSLVADPGMARWEVRVVARHRSQPMDLTRGMRHVPEAEPVLIPPGAFLIIDGERHYPLDQPVVNLGRRPDNQIVLDDPHVSRLHAQLRVREGRFILFDLGSTAGTQVNGRRIQQHVLRAGDVIRIGACSLVYGEDAGGTPDATPTYAPPATHESADGPPMPAGYRREETDT